MRVIIPEFKTKAEAFFYLKSNEKSLIKQKTSLPIKSDIYEYGCLPVNKGQVVKEDGSILNPNEIEVNAIANLSGWCDSYFDVMIKDSWKKTIIDKAIVYHLKNHKYSTDDIVGKDPELYTKLFDLAYFGIESDVTKAQALMMRSIVTKEYDEKTFYLYRDNQIKQHSIGLRYIIIKLCLDSPEDEDKTYKENWDKYYPQVINKAKVDGRGYFWAVVEAKILENSCVLFGANENTGTYSTSSKEEEIEEIEAVEDTSPPEPSKVDTQPEVKRRRQ
jgi:hypothetical protein